MTIRRPKPIDVVCTDPGWGYVDQPLTYDAAVTRLRPHHTNHRALAAEEARPGQDLAPAEASGGQDRPRRLDVLDEAAQIISSDRNSTYGEPEDNLGRIAALWTVYLERPVSPRDVAWLMVLVKVAREVHAPHDDNPVDVAGYAALAGEVAA